MLQMAVHFYEQGHYPTDQPAKPGSQRKLKLPGYQVSKTTYQILKALIPDHMSDIPRSRIVEYRYIQVDAAIAQQRHYFVLPITAAQLAQVEAITRTEHQPRVYLWRDEAWWSFPQLETYTDGELATYTLTVTDYGPLSAFHSHPPAVRTETRQIEKTKLRVRPTYEPAKGPGFTLTQTASNKRPNAPANLPTSISGNGMVLEWKRGYADKAPCWWIRDERRVSKAHSATYRHYAAIKSVSNTRWSKTFSAWYFTGGSLPPQQWLELVGYTATPTSPPEDELPPRPLPSEAESRRLAFLERQRAIAAELAAKRALAEVMKPYHEYQALLRLRQTFEERLHHLTALKALPALATPALDDPWS